MAQVSLRIGKLKTSILGAAQNHNQRFEIPPNADPSKVEFNRALVGDKNQIADLTKSDLNKNLTGKNNLAEAVLNRIQKTGVTVARGKQNESTVAIEIIVSASPEYFRPNNLDKWGSFEEEKLEPWIDANMDFLKKKFGDNLVRVDLHLDEATPHMHAIVTPIISQKRKHRRTKAQIKAGLPAKTEIKSVLNASKMFNKEALIQLQTDAAEAVKHLGIKRGDRNSKATHTELKEWYKDKFTRDVTAVQVEINQEQIEEQEQELLRLSVRLEDLKPTVQNYSAAAKKLALIEMKISNATRELEQIEQSTMKLKRQTNPHAYLMEQKIKRLESTLSAYVEKYGELDTSTQKNPDMGDSEPTNSIFKR